MDLKDFSKVKFDSGKADKTQTTNTSSGGYEQIVGSFLSNFGKISEDELLIQIKGIIEKQKADGTFEEQKIRGLIEKISPFLNQSQRQKIERILN